MMTSVLVYLLFLVPQVDSGNELEALKNGYERDRFLFRLALDLAKSDEARETLVRERDPAPKYIAKARDFAKRVYGTELGAQALAFACGIARTSESFMEVAEELAREYPDSPALAEVAANAGHSLRDRTLQFLRGILEATKSSKVQAAASVAVASSLLARSRRGLEADSLEITKEARLLLEAAIRDLPHSTYAQEAQGWLFELDHLQIGMIAPDFHAQDQDGVSFRLSDYRGKAVLINFWADD